MQLTHPASYTFFGFTSNLEWVEQPSGHLGIPKVMEKKHSFKTLIIIKALIQNTHQQSFPAVQSKSAISVDYL